MPALRLLLAWALLTSLAAGEPGPRVREAMAQVPRGGEAAVAVWDCRADRWGVVAGDPGPLRLASTAKLLVAAAALHELGPDFSFVTRVCALGPVRDGTVPGLGVIGGGDPTLDEHHWEGEPERVLRQWAERVRAAGIERIAGDLVIDSRLFSGPIRPATYPTAGANLTRWFSAPASAFAFNDNCIDVRAVPTTAGQPCRIDVRPRSSRIRVDNRTRTVTGKGDGTFQVSRAANANSLTVAGNFGRTTAWFPVAIHEDPGLLAGDAFAAALREAGVRLDGAVRLGAVDPRLGAVLVEHRSPLLPALNTLNQRSQNFYGEQILRLVGRKRLGEGSIAAGTAAVRSACLPLMGEDGATVTLLDGSGLSYGNVGSARALVHLLAAMDAGPHAGAFFASLRDRPHAGVTGKVKTGTLATTTCLAGYVDGPRGRLAFAILLGQGTATSWAWAAPLRDRLFEVIAEAVR